MEIDVLLRSFTDRELDVEIIHGLRIVGIGFRETWGEESREELQTSRQESIECGVL